MKIVTIVAVQLLFGLGLARSEGDEDFLRFLTEFSSNPHFQVQRIKFPIQLRKLTRDLKDTTIVINGSSTWKHLQLIDPRQSFVTDIACTFTPETCTSNERVLKFIGVETGVSVKYFFLRQDGNWFLMRIEDRST